jgi:hypothetical protein
MHHRLTRLLAVTITATTAAAGAPALTPSTGLAASADARNHGHLLEHAPHPRSRAIVPGRGIGGLDLGRKAHPVAARLAATQ